jgi:predicted nucleic acid-binding protein
VSFLLDTNVLSEMSKPAPDHNVLGWIDRVDESLLHLSVLTIGEIRKGIQKLPPGRRRAYLEAWLDTDLRTRFTGRVLPVDYAIASRWGALAAQADRAGKRLPVIDGLLAATALEHDLTFVTRNASDVAVSGVRLLNPWL